MPNSLSPGRYLEKFSTASRSCNAKPAPRDHERLVRPGFNPSRMSMDHTRISVQLEFHPLAALCVAGGWNGVGGEGGRGSDLMEAAGQQLSLVCCNHKHVSRVSSCRGHWLSGQGIGCTGLQLSAIRGSGSGIRDKDCRLQPPKLFINDVIPPLAAVEKA